MKLVTVERADDLAILNPPFAKLPAFVRTDILDRVQLSFVLKDRHFIAIQAD